MEELLDVLFEGAELAVVDLLADARKHPGFLR